MKTQLKGVLMLLLAAFIWGVAFVAQSIGMRDIEAFTFSGIRTLMGATVLLPLVLMRERIYSKNMSDAQIEDRKRSNKKTIYYGIVLGIIFSAASNFQQFAFNYSTSGKIAFITTLYMFFVPLFGLFLKKRVPLFTWICVAFGFVGLYFLSINPNDLGAINKGDVLTLVCAILYAVHILCVEKFALDVDGIKLSFMQFVVSGVISCTLMFVFEDPQIHAIKSAIVPLLYAGVLSCGIAYTFQIIGQRHTESTIASLLMCMESVFAVLAAALVLNERLSGRELLGCIIMFSAILLSQFSEVLSRKVKTSSLKGITEKTS